MQEEAWGACGYNNLASCLETSHPLHLENEKILFCVCVCVYKSLHTDEHFKLIGHSETVKDKGGLVKESVAQLRQRLKRRNMLEWKGSIGCGNYLLGSSFK